MKPVGFAGVALLFFVGGTSVPAERQCPETIHNSYQCFQFLEKELAKDYPTLFSRTGTQLVIALANGEKKTYVDFPDEKNDGVEGKRYSFVQYYPEISYGLIAVQYYEGGTYYLVNLKNGKDKDIISSPVISPDRKRIAVSNVDLESQYTPNVLSVYSLRSNDLVTEFLERPADWGAGNLRWVTNEELSFIRYDRNPNPPYEIIKTPKTLRYRKETNRWSIE
jgi:hypothetical protein